MGRDAHDFYCEADSSRSGNRGSSGGSEARFQRNLAAEYAKELLGGDHPDKHYELTKGIVQAANQIKMTDVATHVSMMNISMPDSQVTMELNPDGLERDIVGAGDFPGAPPVKLKAAAVWQGGTLLVTESRADYGGKAITLRLYFLSEDGLNLIELVEGHNIFQDTDQRLVFDKQP